MCGRRLYSGNINTRDSRLVSLTPFSLLTFSREDQGVREAPEDRRPDRARPISLRSRTRALHSKTRALRRNSSSRGRSLVVPTMALRHRRLGHRVT